MQNIGHGNRGTILLLLGLMLLLLQLDCVGQNKWRVSASKVDGLAHFDGCPNAPPYDKDATLYFSSPELARREGFKLCPRCKKSGPQQSTTTALPPPIQEVAQRQALFVGDSLFANRFDKYESEKKELAEAYLFSAILPGGGFFYVGEELPGFGFLAVDVAIVVWLVDDLNNGYSATAQWVTLIVSKLVEYAFVTSDVDSFNSSLRHSLGFAFGVSPRTGISCSISINL